MLLNAYAAGIFPMAESQDDPELYWIDPETRGILPLDGFHIPKRLRRTLKTSPFTIKIDTSFEAVIKMCAAHAPDRPSTWINAQVLDIYGQLFEQGHCHTVETWLDGELVGGLYGIRLRGAFFGESMFSRQTDASKIALVYLIARLNHGGFTLLDTQFVTEHLARFGTIEIERADYHNRLATALETKADFYSLALEADVDEVLQLVSHTS